MTPSGLPGHPEQLFVFWSTHKLRKTENFGRNNFLLGLEAGLPPHHEEMPTRRRELNMLFPLQVLFVILLLKPTKSCFGQSFLFSEVCQYSRTQKVTRGAWRACWESPGSYQILKSKCALVMYNIDGFCVRC